MTAVSHVRKSRSRQFGTCRQIQASCILFLWHLSIDLLTTHSPRYLLSFRQNFHAPIGFLFSCSVVSNSLWPHGLQHTRLPCPSLSPAVCSDSCPLSQWCYLTISSSAAPFCFCLQSFPASGSFPISQLFTSKYWSFRFSNSPSNEYLVLISFRMDWFDLLAVQGTLKSFLQVPQFKSINSLVLSLL